VGRRILWASLALAPAAAAVDLATDAGDVTIFVLSALALIPLAWLIGEATEHAAEHTGPGIGGFLNASFGNAPELIIALFAVGDDLPQVVRGSLAGSVISNLLLVLGFGLALGKEAPLDRRSLMLQIGLVALAVVLFVIPSVPGWHGDPNRHSLAVLTTPVAAVLLVVYVVVQTLSLRRHSQAHSDEPSAGAWSLAVALGALGAATAATAVISEILVHSLDGFAKAVGLTQFFIAVVIVAVVGNAAEHGGAVVIARRGNMKLATEIAISSSAQVALFVAPAVALLAWAVTPALTLSFRWEELVAMALATVIVALLVRDGRSRPWEGMLLIGIYVAIAVWFGFAGDR
jgi:Ca2+:H+ antiporter